MYRMFTIPNGSGIVGTPQQTHLDEIVEALEEQFNPNFSQVDKMKI